MGSKTPNLTLTCSCGHNGMWHRGRCRIRNCDCPKFTYPPYLRRSADSSWLEHGKPYHHAKGHGS